MLETLVNRGNLPPVLPGVEQPNVTSPDIIEFECQANEEDEDEEVEITFEDAAYIHQKHLAAKTTREAAKLKMRKRKVTIGFHHHHGVLTPLPSDFVEYPQMNLQQLITMWLMGSPSEGIIALRQLNSKTVGYFDKEGANLSKMRRVMCAVEHFGNERGVWKPWHVKSEDYWNGVTITKLWEGICGDLLPLMETVTNYDDASNPSSKHKSRPGDLRWRTCHDRLAKEVFKLLEI
jgi:hypothetical protein